MANKKPKEANEPRKKSGITFHDTGCLIGILIMAYYNPLHKPNNKILHMLFESFDQAGRA